MDEILWCYYLNVSYKAVHVLNCGGVYYVVESI